MKAFLLVLALSVFTSCGKKEKQTFGGGVGVGSGGQYSNYVSKFGITINANSNLNFQEDDSAFFLDNSHFAKGEGALVSRLRAQKVIDSWFNDKEMSVETLNSYLLEKEPETTFVAKKFSHHSGLCNEMALSKGTSLICFVPFARASLLVRFRLDIFENSPESYLLSQAMNSVKESN
jgi:hypothetical protein